jgi:hypothetical protein
MLNINIGEFTVIVPLKELETEQVQLPLMQVISLDLQGLLVIDAIKNALITFLEENMEFPVEYLVYDYRIEGENVLIFCFQT